MTRTYRSDEELRGLRERDPTLFALCDDLTRIPNVTVDPDGTGACVFKVYIDGHKGPYESFLWLYTPYTESYVAWEHQREHAKEVCRRLWAPYVKNATNPNGSFLSTDVSVETIMKIVEEYACQCGPMFPLRAKDIDPPRPERVETTVYRILRDTALARRLKDLHKHECQICGFTICLPDGSRYAEAHHIRPLGSPHDGPDVPENIIVLCPNCHAMCDYGVIQLDADHLRSHSDHHVGREFIEYHNAALHGVVLSRVELLAPVYMGSPRFQRTQQAADFRKEVVEENHNAGV